MLDGCMDGPMMPVMSQLCRLRGVKPAATGSKTQGTWCSLQALPESRLGRHQYPDFMVVSRWFNYDFWRFHPKPPFWSKMSHVDNDNCTLSQLTIERAALNIMKTMGCGCHNSARSPSSAEAWKTSGFTAHLKDSILNKSQNSRLQTTCHSQSGGQN